MPFPDTPDGLARLLAQRVPASAARVATATHEGWSWRGRGDAPAAGLLDLPVFVCLDRSGRPSTGFHYGSDACEAYAGFLPWPLLRDLGLSGDRVQDGGRGPAPEGFAPFAARFAEAVDFPALRLVAGADAADPDAYGWLAARGPEGDRRRAFAASFPWALDALLESGAELWDEPDADVACDLVRGSGPEGAGPRQTLRRLVEAGRGLGLHALDRRGVMRGMRAASRLPADWIPRDAEGLEALLALAPHLIAHARRSGLPPAEAARPGPGWDRLLARILDRAGLGAHPAPVQARIAGLSLLVEDRLDAFSDQVLRPALDAAGVDAAESSLLRGAHRLVVGARSYPAAIEDALAWQSRRTGAAEAVAALADRAGISWDVPFAPVRDRLGVEVRCLATPAELVEEGRALRHCVARYLPACLAGERAIVSIRKPGGPGREPERLSTLELARAPDGRFAPAQHRGAANGPPPDVAGLAARRLARALAGAAPVPPPDPAGARSRIAALFRHDPGAGKALWRDVLGPLAEETAPEAILAAAGLAPEPSGPRPG